MKNKFLQRQTEEFSTEKKRYISYIAVLQEELEKTKESYYEKDDQLGKQAALVQNLSKALQKQVSVVISMSLFNSY